MPFYDYVCENHGKFEKIKKISDRFTCECPECGVVCEQALTVPAGVKGGYMDKSISMTKSSVRGNH